jgi:replicative DNA helicase
MLSVRSIWMNACVPGVRTNVESGLPGSLQEVARSAVKRSRARETRGGKGKPNQESSDFEAVARSVARNRVRDIARSIGDYPLSIEDRVYQFSQIVAGISKARADLVVIDYLGLIETSGRFENRNQEISYLSRRLKLCATQNDVPLLVLSQLNRASDVESRKPRASDLRDSGSLEQDADAILFLHQPSTMKHGAEVSRDQIHLLIEKQRNGARNLCVYLQMQGHFCRMVETTNNQ